jgi:inosine-uridine nucleoside N-ribohydrolase
MARMQMFVALGAALLVIAASSAPPSHAQVTSPGATRELKSRTRIIIDTDIGDDIDDAFAVGLALNSHELQIEGITTAWGDTALRARLLQRLLAETGHAGIPVAVGIPTKSKVPFTQARWAKRGPALLAPPDAVDFLLDHIRRNPGEITLVAIGPYTNLGAAIDRDPATFRKLKRVVLMGGSIRRGYDDLGYEPDRGPSAEYNIASDIPAAKKLFQSGVPIYMMPLDSTQLKLDEVKRAILFRQGTPMTDALTLLYHQWDQQTPTLFDVMTVTYVLEPKLCPTKPLHVEIDENGFTKVSAGTPNVSVCLSSDSDEFFHFVLPRLMRSPDVSAGPRDPLSSPAH